MRLKQLLPYILFCISFCLDNGYTLRQPLQKDKTADENYYLLTLETIAKEIAYRNAPAKVPVILAAGLPLTNFGREEKAFRAYLLRESKPVSFSYEGISYEVSVQDVKLFPQGYLNEISYKWWCRYVPASTPGVVPELREGILAIACRRNCEVLP